jgi:hypothetical protein
VDLDLRGQSYSGAVSIASDTPRDDETTETWRARRRRDKTVSFSR